MKILPVWRLLGAFLALNALWTWGADYAPAQNASGPSAPGTSFQGTGNIQRKSPTAVNRLDMGWTERVITERELEKLSRKDPELSPSTARAILARLNNRAKYYIKEDIENGRPLKVPNNFSAFKYWSPMPVYISEVSDVSKFILVVKDIPFIAWYENGKLIGDAEICIGKKEGLTQAGVYRVENKDADHISRSYPNAFGEPAPMPWALRIYDHVWIHAGDIAKGYCSHGCINLPLMPAADLFKWADSRTVVIVAESLNSLAQVFRQNRSNCTLYASACGAKRSSIE